MADASSRPKPPPPPVLASISPQAGSVAVAAAASPARMATTASLTSQSPSPLVLSDCSSPSLASPPPAPQLPPSASSSLFYRSASAAAEPGQAMQISGQPAPLPLPLPPPLPPPSSATTASSTATTYVLQSGSGGGGGGGGAPAQRLESVLTHEHNDPMLSASASAPTSMSLSSAGATSVSLGAQMRPVVLQERQSVVNSIANGASGTLPSSIQLPTVPLPLTPQQPQPQPQQQQQQQQQPQQQQKEDAVRPPQAPAPAPGPGPGPAAQHLSLAGASVQAVQQPLQPEQLSGSKPDPPKKDRLTLYGCFAANLADSKRASKPYIIHVFDKGSYFKSGTEPDSLLMEQLSRGTGVVFDALYAKNNPNRVTFDQVLLKLNNQWISVPKPGTAVKAMDYVAADTVFFLQATALLKVNLFVQKQSGVQWITDCRFVTNTNIQNAIVHTDFNVLITASSKSTANRRPSAATSGSPTTLQPRLQALQPQQQQQQQQASTPPTAASVNGDHPMKASETLHLSSGTITLHSGVSNHSTLGSTTNNSSSSSGVIVSQGSGFAGPSNRLVSQPQSSAATSVLRNCDYQLSDSQYSAITLEQVTCCTSCAQCNRRFKYAIENFFHFVMSPPCRTYVLKSREASLGAADDSSSAAAAAAASGGVSSFSHTLYALIARQCKLAPDTALRCDTCATTTHGPLQYCIHRDQHQPVHGDISLCQFCGIIYRTPHCFYRHKCISSWDLKSTLSRFETTHLPMAATTEDAFKIYSHLTEDEKAKILKCPVCNKVLCYMSGLLAHLKSSSECFAALRQQAGATANNECVDLSALTLSKNSLAPRALKCETCGLDSRNQIAYAIHRDHHTLKKQGMLICKGCNSEYRAPCEFYRHNCSSQKNAIKLQWCPFCEVARHCDRLKENSAAGALKSSAGLGSAASPAVTSPAPFPPDASPSPSTPATPVTPLGPAEPPPQYNNGTRRPSTTSAATLRSANCDTNPAAEGAASSGGSELMKRLLSSTPSASTSSSITLPPRRPFVMKAEIDDERDELEEALRKIHQGESNNSLASRLKEEAALPQPAAGQLDGHAYYLESEDDESQQPSKNQSKKAVVGNPSTAAARPPRGLKRKLSSATAKQT